MSGAAHTAGRRTEHHGDTPRKTLKMAKEAALGIEAAGTLLAQAIGRMQTADRASKHGRGEKEKRDAAWVHEWREILVILNSHADAMTVFLGGFMSAPFFRQTAQAAHEQELAERRAEVLDEPQGAERGGAA